MSAFATAGKEFKVIDEEAEEIVVIPYDEIAEKAIDILGKQICTAV